MAGAIDKKSEVHQVGCKHTSTDHGEDLDLLQKELANSYYWSGNCRTDYRFFICNWHPLLGMFLSHPLHPWSKLERIAMLVCSVCLSLVPIALQIQGGRRGELRNSGNLGAQMKLLVLVSLPLMLWELVAYWISIMDIYCMGKHKCLAKCARIFKNFILFLSLIGGAFCAVVAIVFIMPKAHEPVSKLFVNLLISRTQMWIVWFPLYLICPFIGFIPIWCREKSKENEAPISSKDIEAQTCQDSTGSPEEQPSCKVRSETRKERPHSKHHSSKEVKHGEDKTAALPTLLSPKESGVHAHVEKLCDVCGRTRDEHYHGKWCIRKQDKHLDDDDKTSALSTLPSSTGALCDVCGKTREEHLNKKWCRREAAVATSALTLCDVCGKTRMEHMDGKFCRR
jgi:uncharacterized membrane protein YsdA (DUF1294 family)